MAREGEGEALFKRGGALEFQEDRGGDNSLAPPTELASVSLPNGLGEFHRNGQVSIIISCSGV